MACSKSLTDEAIAKILLQDEDSEEDGVENVYGMWLNLIAIICNNDFTFIQLDRNILTATHTGSIT